MKKMIWLFLALAVPGMALAGDDLVRKPSVHSVQETADHLEALVKEKGMTVFARIDHKANAESVGKKMPDSQLLIFGAPEAGTRIMLSDPAAGVDLPMRVLTYADLDGDVWVVYHNPQGMKDDFALEESKVLEKIEGALAGITDQATR